jgi:UDP-4-amino-4-deoxy-L-arabinose formyltransferase / UDP-glucuronic acid dehydrogenase (UDP-4-keto-hexauronic acid decarboxylating)
VTRFPHMKARKNAPAARRLRVLILGVNGFLGNALAERLLAEGVYEVHGVDVSDAFVAHLNTERTFHFHEGEVCLHAELVDECIRRSDIVVPLMSVTTELEHVSGALQKLELDLEETQRIMRYTTLLRWVRLCAEEGTRLVLPGAAETYGLCGDPVDEDESPELVNGLLPAGGATPSQQLLDRVIWMYAQRNGLRFTLFRPLDWLGPRLDKVDSARVGNSRIVARLMLDLVEGAPLLLVDGGRPRRCFTDVSDGVECLFRIVENRSAVCDGRIFNIGNPSNGASIEQLAALLVTEFEAHELRAFFPPLAGIRKVERRAFGGESAHGVQTSAADIRNAEKYLGWTPKVSLGASVARALDFYLRERVNAANVRLARLQNVVRLRHVGIKD